MIENEEIRVRGRYAEIWFDRQSIVHKHVGLNEAEIIIIGKTLAEEKN